VIKYGIDYHNMERRLNKKADDHASEFKNSVKEYANQLGISQTNEEMSSLLQFIYDYRRLEFGKEDLTRRKRVKNAVPFFERCCANRANGEQCTRRKKEVEEYCGTHMKGTPHGVMSSATDDVKTPSKQIEVWAQDIRGIIYYLDINANVYQPEDIISNKINPRIIAKYVRVGEVYSIINI
jgi:hypothetical protein